MPVHLAFGWLKRMPDLLAIYNSPLDDLKRHIKMAGEISSVAAACVEC